MTPMQTLAWGLDLHKLSNSPKLPLVFVPGYLRMPTIFFVLKKK